jgi:PleD family two-component response regulator
MLADRRRVLIAVNKTHEGEMKSLFERDPLTLWQPLFADSFSRARFTLQHNPCEALLVHEALLQAEGHQGLSWLAWKKDYPTLFTGQSAQLFQRAFEVGVQHCLAFDMALAHPPLMATALDHAIKHVDNARNLRRSKEQLAQARKHVDRLVTLMWRAAPHHEDNQWYSEPFMLERLQEELARAERHKIPLSLAVGEMMDDEARDPVLPDWTADALIKTKRRCDVVGQYGPKGFLLLMVHTPKTGAMTCCKRVQTYLEHSAESLPGPRLPLRAFFGMSSTIGERMSPQSLLRSAEENLGAARHDKTLRIVAS